jgi:hypothetical protein
MKRNPPNLAICILLLCSVTSLRAQTNDPIAETERHARALQEQKMPTGVPPNASGPDSIGLTRERARVLGEAQMSRPQVPLPSSPQTSVPQVSAEGIFRLAQQNSIPTISGTNINLAADTRVGVLSVTGNTFRVTADGVNAFDVPRAMLLQWNDPAAQQAVANSINAAIARVAAITQTTREESVQPRQAQRYRVGAICNDGWESKATGSGACSHHGGVMCWKYSDATCTKP